MGKRIVIALGGNALGTSLPEQMKAVKITAKAIVDLIEQGHEVAIAHGNGPQVGMMQNAMTQLVRSDPDRYVPCPLSVCVAMSQGYIGYDLQNALREEMLDRGISKGVATVLTQVEVDPGDPAFDHPTKPIGAFMTKEEADRLVRERQYDVVEDSGRGYRRVVASPKPVSIIEIGTIQSLLDTDHVVVACGGGGIPVFRTQGHHLKGAAAVIDKDFAASRLAQQLDADVLIILTAVEKVAIRFGTPEQTDLDELTPDLARKYIRQGEFAPGSMLPKVEAAVEFAESGPGRSALITLLSKASEGDIIKSQDEFAYFHKGTGWKGNLQYMKPGKGYMLYHTRTAASPDSLVTFTYPNKNATAGVKSKAFNSEDREQRKDDAPLFSCHKLTTMNMILRAEGVTAEPGDLLYAYADGELCGLAEAEADDALEQTVFYMSVGCDKPSPITFTLERNGQLLGTAAEAATYQANAVEGTPDSPATLRFGITAAASAYEPDVWYTVSGIRLGESRPATPGIYLRNGQKIVVR